MSNELRKTKNSGMRQRRTNLKFLEIIPIVVLITILVGFSLKVFDFEFEDAYIIFRYAIHLSDGYGFVWNIGEDPVQGSTTFLWPVILAFFGKLGLPIVSAAKFLNVVFASLTVLCIYFASKNFLDNSRITSFVVSFPFTLAIITHIATGMETVFFSFALTLTFISGFKFIEENDLRSSKKIEIILPLLFLLLILIRPEGLVFSVSMFASLLLYKKLFMKDPSIPFILKTIFLFILPSVIFYLCCKVYFGDFLPNPFYLKKSVEIISLSSIRNMYAFFSYCVIPYLIIIVLWLINSKKEQRIKVFMISLPVIVFLFAHLTIAPSMNIGFRYLLPLLPIILILASKPIEHYIARYFSGLTKIKDYCIPDKAIFNLLIILIILIFLLWPASLLMSNCNTQDDRKVVGNELNKFAGKNYTMMVTEAGHLPYYSEWNVIDAWGLNNEFVAHNGLTIDYIRKNDPELIQFHAFSSDGNTIRGYVSGKWSIMLKKLYLYAEENDYTLACIIKKPGGGSYHWYYVKKNFNDSNEIVNILRNLEGADYVYRGS